MAQPVANHAVRSVWLLASLIALGVTISCSRDKHRGDGGTAPESPKPASTEAAPRKPSPEEPSAQTDEAPAASEHIEPQLLDHGAPSVAPAGSTSFEIGELHDIGPAGPASAWARGVVMVTRDSELLLSPLDARGRFRELDTDRSRFARYGRGPALTARFAYWIDLEGRLRRALLDRPAQVEEIHSSARSGTRVSALSVGERELVAFVAEIEDVPRSLLWSSSGELLRLSPEGSTATSVELAPLDRSVLALTLAGRTGMSPVHGRTIRVAQRRVNLDDDRVIWVGPGAHPLTELTTLASTDQVFGFLAAARSITEFGLSYFPINAALEPVSEARFSPYPNGIDPAPVAAASLCGGAYVLYAQPSDVRPRSPQELRIAPLTGGTLGTPEVLARARAFNDISVAARPGGARSGAVLVWTADRHTWALTLACPQARPYSGAQLR